MRSPWSESMLRDVRPYVSMLDMDVATLLLIASAGLLVGGGGLAVLHLLDRR